MSAPRIFVTGVSGYLGGHTVSRIIAKHPSWHLAVLVRNEQQKNIIHALWPQLEIVIGDLDNAELLISEASKADVVLQTASSDHIPGILSLLRGLSLNPSSPGYLLHVSGTGLLNSIPHGFGQPSSKIYSDITSLSEITSFPIEGHVHRDVDAAILKAQAELKVPTAIVSPPMIYGVGKGPVKRRSIQIPFLVENVLRRGAGFMVGEGRNVWDGTHIDDVSDAFILLIEEALKPNGGNAQWGPQGYYFVNGAEFKWGDISKAIAVELHRKGAIKSPQVDKLTVEEATELHPWAGLLWGGNCRSPGERIRMLGWEPKGGNWEESLEEMVEVEIGLFGKQISETTFDK